MKTIELGPRVIVSDPVYEKNTKSIIPNVKPGKWIVSVKTMEKGDLGKRNAFLKMTHKDTKEKDLVWKKKRNFCVDVDSGQAGIFDVRTYRDEGAANMIPWSSNKPAVFKDDLWYSKISDMTLDRKNNYWGTYANGAASASGWGDGGYDLYVAKENNKIVGMYIDFNL